jgi:hypothetical protein
VENDLLGMLLTSSCHSKYSVRFFSAGSRPDEILPPLERMLEAHELGTLKDKSSFQYLLKMGYENVHRTLNIDP